MNKTFSSFVKEVKKIYKSKETDSLSSNSRHLISDLFVTAFSLLICVSLTLVVFLVLG